MRLTAFYKRLNTPPTKIPRRFRIFSLIDGVFRSNPQFCSHSARPLLNLRIIRIESAPAGSISESAVLIPRSLSQSPNLTPKAQRKIIARARTIGGGGLT
jgi:hypothetical protein